MLHNFGSPSQSFRNRFHSLVHRIRWWSRRDVRYCKGRSHALLVFPKLLNLLRVRWWHMIVRVLGLVGFGG